jgi:hypothetical protein
MDVLKSLGLQRFFDDLVEAAISSLEDLMLASVQDLKDWVNMPQLSAKKLLAAASRALDPYPSVKVKDEVGPASAPGSAPATTPAIVPRGGAAQPPVVVDLCDSSDSELGGDGNGGIGGGGGVVGPTGGGADMPGGSKDANRFGMDASAAASGGGGFRRGPSLLTLEQLVAGPVGVDSGPGADEFGFESDDGGSGGDGEVGENIGRQRESKDQVDGGGGSTLLSASGSSSWCV